MRNTLFHRFQTKVCNIQPDKYVHLLACQVIAFLISLALYPFMGKYGTFVSLPVTIAIGFYKEVGDDEFNYEDFKFDIIGSIWGIMYFLL